ncbi:tuberin-like [Hetaerina americana]|uniref:tuberin-like n=1 Tax=Hetaerina americana TaxID=62018 RepID=UPI003A7F58FD
MSKTNAKEKEKPFHEKLKQFFRINKGNFRGRVDCSLTQEIEKEISPDNPNHQRIKAIKELSDLVLNNRLEDNSIERLWILLGDLLQKNVAKEHRHIAFAFFRCLVQGQYEKLGMMRAQFFRIIKTHDIPEDANPRLDLLQSLTENGKDIQYFEEEIAPFLLHWMPAIAGTPRTNDFLLVLVNLIKYNAGYVDEDIIVGLVENTCLLCLRTNSKEVVLSCIQVLDAVVCYSILPFDSLTTFICALCRTANIEPFYQSCWKIMRNLLGTHMGHSALYTMCRLLQDPLCSQDYLLLRGAVIHINMGLWGSEHVTSLKCTPTSILPSYIQAMKYDYPIVNFEVIWGIQRLVDEHGSELHDPAWDLVLTIVELTITHIETSAHTNHKSRISSNLHETISKIEKLIEKDQFNGCVGRVYDLIERCSAGRPEGSVLRLVSYLSSSMVPTRATWLDKIRMLVEKYFRYETRTSIRIRVLDILSDIIRTNRSLYEEDLMERVVVPHLQHVDSDPDTAVRNAAAQLLIDLCLECESKRCLELLDILEKILSRPYELDLGPFVSEAEVPDVRTVVVGLIHIFRVKLYQLPSSHAIKAYKLLVNHLEAHYKKPSVFDNVSSLRYKIIECFLQIRANSHFHLGFPETTTGGGGAAPPVESSIVSPSATSTHGSQRMAKLRFSPYLAVDHRHSEKPPGAGSSPPPSTMPPASSVTTSAPPPSTAPPSTAHLAHHPSCTITHLSLTYACKAVFLSLIQERDWKVLHLILQEIPQVMQNKALILSRDGANDVDNLAHSLCLLVSEKSLGLPETLRNTPGSHFPKSDFHGHVFPAIASLASYHCHLDPTIQALLIKCLEVGLASRKARDCVSALSVCALEMRDAMGKLLPEVLLHLSKISATVHVAVPILEFLSTLTRLPKVFASFVGDQYLSIFAIALPYTNPFKYNHYTVSLAHHVIAVWFLKCRLPFRRDFVKFITTGLKANVLVPFEEGQIMKTELVNEDSSNRKRSSSLTEQGSRRRERPLPGATREGGRSADLKPAIDEALMNFHMELTETCIDLMARYTFSSCSTLPKRHSAVDFLLADGQSMTWILGNKVITVTTSGYSQKPLKNGLCEKCWMLFKAEKETSPTDTIADLDLTPSRRRHKSAIQRSVSSDVAPIGPRTKDDLHMHHKLYRQSSGEVALSAMASHAALMGSSNRGGSLLSPQEEMKKGGPMGNGPGAKPQPLLASEINEPEPSKLDHMLFGSEKSENQDKQLCACWCQGWAEIHIKRPTGDVSWVMRIQNQAYFQTSPLDFPLADISTLFLPSLSKEDKKFQDFVTGHKRIDSENLGESEYDAILDHHFDQASDVSASFQVGQGGASHLGPSPMPSPSPLHSKRSSPSPHMHSSSGLGQHPPATVPIDRQNSGSSQKSDSISIKEDELQGSAKVTGRKAEKEVDKEDDSMEHEGECEEGEAYPLGGVEEEGVRGRASPSVAVAIEGRARNPVRRSNSSPEMNSNWRNPFLAASPFAHERDGASETTHMVIAGGGAVGDPVESGMAASGERWMADGKPEAPCPPEPKKLNKPIPLTKDTRVSYEAIPEEIFGPGTTPPRTSMLLNQEVTRSTVGSAPGLTAPTPATVMAPPRSSNLQPTAGTDAPLPGRSPSAASTPAASSSSSSSVLVSSNARVTRVGGGQDGLRSPTVPAAPIQDLLASHAVLAAAKTATLASEVYSKLKPSAANRKEDAISGSSQQMGSNTEGSSSQQPAGGARPDPSSLPPLAFKRDRGHTISVMSPVRKPRVEWDFSASRVGGTSPRGGSGSMAKEAPRTGINPSFVFLQLYHNAHFGSTSEKPILVPSNSKMAKIGLRNLDYIPPYETHKIGVIYVGPGQANSEADILRNQFGSLRYAEFLQRLGTIVRLSDIDPHTFFLGGLDRNGNDGKFTYIWHDDVTQIVFHVATLMTTTERFNEKKKHIGNDYVTIVYNESGEDYNIQTVKGQFNYACVVIQPLDHGTNKVTVKTKEELAEHIGHSEPRIISNQNVAILARQLALHANLASLISCSLKTMGQSPYASNWLERLRQIKRLRAKVVQEMQPSGGGGVVAPGGDGVTSGSGAAGVVATFSPEFTSPVAAATTTVSHRLPGNARRGVMMEDFTEYA